MKDDTERGELGPLSLRADPARWEQLNAAIEAAAVERLNERARARRTIRLSQQIEAWLRPALTFASAVALIAAVLLRVAGTDPGDDLSPGLADQLGYPSAIGLWLETGWVPSVEAMLVTMNETAP